MPVFGEPILLLLFFDLQDFCLELLNLILLSFCSGLQIVNRPSQINLLLLQFGSQLINLCLLSCLNLLQLVFMARLKDLDCSIQLDIVMFSGFELGLGVMQTLSEFIGNTLALLDQLRLDLKLNLLVLKS